MTTSTRATRCRRRFLSRFPGAFRDATYLTWERAYKWDTQTRLEAGLGKAEHERLLLAGEYDEKATRALRVEQQSRDSMIFSFEKMALRDGVRTPEGAQRFARGLFAYLHGTGGAKTRFDAWVVALDGLPRTQTRVLTWPVVSVFGFIAKPRTHLLLKSTVTRRAAAASGVDR